MIFDGITINISNIENAEFYKTLGFKIIEERNPDVIEMKAGDIKLTLKINKNAADALQDKRSHLSLKVDNIEAVRSSLLKYKPEEIDKNSNSFFVQDPDGQYFKIVG